MEGRAVVIEDGDAVEAPRLAEQLEGFRTGLRGQQDDPGDIVAATTQQHVEEEVRSVRIARRSHHNRNRLRRVLSGASGPAATRQDDVDVETAEFWGRLGQDIGLPVRITVLEEGVRAGCPASLGESMLEDVARHSAGPGEPVGTEDADPRSFSRQLRVRSSWSEQCGQSDEE